jgi:hypothetical protein
MVLMAGALMGAGLNAKFVINETGATIVFREAGLCLDF